MWGSDGWNPVESEEGGGEVVNESESRLSAAESVCYIHFSAEKIDCCVSGVLAAAGYICMSHPQACTQPVVIAFRSMCCEGVIFQLAHLSLWLRTVICWPVKPDASICL